MNRKKRGGVQPPRRAHNWMRKRGFLLLLLATAVMASGCQKKETVSSNAVISEQSTAEKEFNGIKITLDEFWKKLSREGDTVTYLYDEGKTTDQTKNVTLKIYAPYLNGSPADKHEYLEYVVHEEVPAMKEADRKKVGDKWWQVYHAEETIAGVDFVYSYYTYVSETGSVLLVLSRPAETDIEEMMDEILASVDAGSESPYLAKKSENLWLWGGSFLLSASSWEQKQDIYMNDGIKLTISTEAEETSRSIKQQMGNPADEETIRAGNRTFDLLLYNGESNTMIDNDVVYVTDGEGCLLTFEGKVLSEYIGNIEMIIRSCESYTEDIGEQAEALEETGSNEEETDGTESWEGQSSDQSE